MKRFGAVLIALLLASGASAAGAQNGPPAGARPGIPGMQAGAQQQGGTIRGTVKDAAGAPLPAARVAVWRSADSTLVAGGVSESDGTFRIEGVRPGAYYLKITLLGYATGTVARVQVTPAAPLADAGEVKLAADAVQLEGISATAERSTVTQAVDRTVYSARDLPAATGGNTTDVLRNVPGVEVDPDGKVSVRGNQNVAVQINGRPAPMTGDALTSFLKQIPANLIERVEVVPNPSAKYDPDGMGGILNIVLKQNADLGTSGGVVLGLGSGDKYNASGNLAHQAGDLTLFGSYGFYADQRANRSFNFRENRYLDPITFLDQDTDGRFRNLSHVLNGTADLKVGSKNVLSTSLMFSMRDGKMDNDNHYALLDADRDLTDQYDRIADQSMDNRLFDASLAFKRTMTPQEHELSAEVRFNRNRDEFDSRFSLFRFGPAGVLQAAPSEVETNLLGTSSRDLVGQVDYTRTLGGTRVEVGYKGTLRQIDNGIDVERTVDGVPAGGPSRDNDFVFNEDVHAVYGQVARSFGKLGLQAGLRAETALTDFNLLAAGVDSTYENDYRSLFPSASASYQASNATLLKASYSRRVQRPQTFFLNPFAISEDPLNVFVGNPYLKPEYTHSFELGVQSALPFGSVQLSPFYRRTEDAIRRYKELDEDGVSITTFRNLATSESYGADLSGNVRLGDRFSAFVSGSAYKVVTDGSNVESSLGSDAFNWSVRGNLTYKLTPRTELQWFQFYRAPMDVEQGRISAFQMANFAVRHKLWGEKASLAVRVSDPFDKMAFRFRTADERHVQESERKFDSRAVFLTFTYNFGQQPRLRQRPTTPDQQQPQPGGDIGIN